MERQHKTPILISCGFDCKMLYWDLGQQAVARQVDLAQLATKYIDGQLLGPPLIYSIYSKPSQYLVSTEQGHVWGFHIKDP